MAGRNAFGLNTSTVAQDLPVAQKRERNRRWERSNPARRYLVSIELRDEVAALAETLVENVDPVACVLFDYADTCHTRGTLKLKPRLNPKGRKHMLAWEEVHTEAEPIQLQSRRHRSVRKTDTRIPSLKGKTAAYRLGEERHKKIKSIAEAYNLPLADVLTAFFHHSLRAYQDGKMKIRREPVVVQMQVKGWSE